MFTILIEEVITFYLVTHLLLLIILLLLWLLFWLWLIILQICNLILSISIWVIVSILREIISEVLLWIIVLIDNDVIIIIFNDTITRQESSGQLFEYSFIPLHIHLNLLVDSQLLLHFLTDDLIYPSVVIM